MARSFSDCGGCHARIIVLKVHRSASWGPTLIGVISVERIQMTKQTSICGAILIALGVIVTIVSDSGSVTSLIPAFMGIILLVLGLAASAKPSMSHHLMHLMAVVALLALLGSLGSLIGRGSTGWALFSQLVTIAVTGFLLVNAIQAFRNRAQESN